MGNVCNKVLLYFFMGLQTFRHMIETFRQSANLIITVHLYSLFKIPIGNDFRRTVHLHQRQCHMFCRQEADDQPKDRNDQQTDHTHLIHFHQGSLNFRHGPAHENTGKIPFRNRIPYYQHRRIKNLTFS